LSRHGVVSARPHHFQLTIGRSSCHLLASELGERAERVDKAHLLDRAGVNIEKPLAADQYCKTTRPGDGDVETIAAEEKLDIARDLLAAGGGHGEERDLGLLALELVDRADADASRKAVLEAAHLGVIGG